MDHSLINPNQIREYGIPVYDNPFSQSQFGIDYRHLILCEGKYMGQ
jgi:hypothetical protein